jgi:hypothetical protein
MQYNVLYNGGTVDAIDCTVAKMIMIMIMMMMMMMMMNALHDDYVLDGEGRTECFGDGTANTVIYLKLTDCYRIQPCNTW